MRQDIKIGKMHFSKQLISLTFCILLSSTWVFGANENIKVTFTPDEVQQGERTKLSITLSGDAKKKFELPALPGLRVVADQTSRDFSIGSGGASYTVNHDFILRAEKAGNYELTQVILGGKKVDIDPVSLTVTEAGEAPTIDSLLQLKVSLDRERYYIGEIIPITLQLYVGEGVSGQILTGPTIEGDIFTQLGHLGNVTKSSRTIGETAFQIFTWKTHLTAYKGGQFPMKYSLDMAVNMPAEASSRPTSSNFFGHSLGSFLNNYFVEQRRVSLQTGDRELGILALPDEGMPRDFTGAIGDFTVIPPTLENTTIQVGEPLSLTLSIRGVGNFDKILPPSLENTENWKTYKPKITFDKKDAIGTAGTKTFEYVMIPESEEATETPIIIFNSFDPERRYYREFDTKAIALVVTPAPEQPAAALLPENTLGGDALSRSRNRSSEPVPIRLRMTNIHPSMSPVFTRPWFYLGQVVPLLGILALFVTKNRRNKRERDLEYQKKQQFDKKLHVHLSNLRKAYSKKNAPGCYHEVQSAIGEIAAYALNSTPEALSHQDILDLLKRRHLPEDVIKEVESVFEMADVIKFGGTNSPFAMKRKNLNDYESLIHKLEEALKS